MTQHLANSLDDDTLGIVFLHKHWGGCIQKQQLDTNDCRLFLIANATALVDPMKLC